MHPATQSPQTTRGTVPGGPEVAVSQANGSGAAAATRRARVERPADRDMLHLASQAGVSLAGGFVARGLNFLGYAVLARALNPVDFGLYAVAMAVLQILETVARLGLSNGVLRLGSKHPDSSSPLFRGVLTQSVLIAVGSGLAVGILLFGSAEFVSTSLFGKPRLTPFLQGFATALPLLCGLRVVADATRLSLRTKFSVYAGDVVPALTHLLLLGLILNAQEIAQATVAARVVSFAVALVCGLLFLTRLFPGWLAVSEIRAESVSRLLSFSAPTALTSILMGTLVSTDRVFLGIFRDASEAGVYQAAAQIAVVMTFLLAAVNTIFAPLAAGAHQRGKTGNLNDTFRVSTRWGLYLSLPLFLAIGAAPETMLSAVYGPRFGEAAVPLMILMIGQLANVATGCAGSLLTMTGHPRQWLSLSAGAVGANLILNALLVPRWGVVGAAAATAAVTGPLYLAGVFRIRRLAGLWPYDKTYWKGIRAAAWTALALALMKAAALPSSAVVILVPMVAVTVFAFALWRQGLDQDFHFGPGTVTGYTPAAPKTTSFRAEPCTSPPPVGARARPSAHRR